MENGFGTARQDRTRRIKDGPVNDMVGFARSWKSLTSSILLVLFTAALLVAGIVSDDIDFSDNENRSLASFPKFSLDALADGSFAQGLSDYASDQFYARDTWTSLDLAVSKASGSREYGGVYIADDGYLIEKSAEPDEGALKDNADAMNAFAEAHQDISFSVAIFPNACSLLADKLPANAPVRDQKADLEGIASNLNERVQFIDVYDAMAAHSFDDSPIFYRTDHHWTSYGAKCGFEAIAPAIGIEPAGAYDIYTVSTTFQGTMASKVLDCETLDEIEIYVPQGMTDYVVSYEDTKEKTTSMYVSSALAQKDQYQVFLGGNHSTVSISTSNLNGRNLLILKDSYANSLVQFLLPYYERIVLVDPRYYYDDLDAVILNNEITEVLVIYNLNTYCEDTALDDVLNTALQDQDKSQFLEDVTGV